MEKIVERGLLYDFYGELLTEHQRRIYEDAVFQDMSLAEIAEEAGISRQGVHDLLRRCDKLLLDYESKLHLAERFMEAKKTVKEILRLTGEASEIGEAESAKRLLEIRKLSNQLLNEL
ncbi:MAG: YlxM family DNA-binding protein [Lachnospiraceae bacterium]|nr:YlxM family DNA-binding protein [Lachnospiraceae bacterium]